MMPSDPRTVVPAVLTMMTLMMILMMTMTGVLAPRLGLLVSL